MYGQEVMSIETINWIYHHSKAVSTACNLKLTTNLKQFKVVKQ